MAANSKTSELDALERVPKVDTPERLRASILPFSRADVIVTTIAVSSATAVSPIYGRPAALGVLFLWVMAMWSHAYGRTYELIGQKFQSLWIKWVRRGVILNSSAHQSWLDHVWERQPPVPLGIQGIGEIGVLHDSKAGTDSIVVVGTGSALSSLPMAVQHQIMERFADGIRKLTSLQRGSVGVSFVFRRRPADTVRLENIYQGILHPEVRELQGRNTAEDIRNQRLNAIAFETVAKARQVAGEVTMAVVVTVPQQELLRKVRNKRRKGKLEMVPPAALRRLGINRLAQVAVEVLASCDINDPRVLGVREVHKYLHDAWEADSERCNEYRRWLADAPADEVGESFRHSPGDIIVGKDHCVTDGSYHSVIRVTGGPGRETDDFFSQLHAANVPWLTVTLLGKVTRSNMEYSWLDRLIPMRDSFRREALGIVYEGPKARKKAEDIVRRQEVIFERRVSERFNILLVVTHTDPEELADGVEEVLRTARTMGLDAEQVFGECRQVPAHWSATTGVDML